MISSSNDKNIEDVIEQMNVCVFVKICKINMQNGKYKYKTQLKILAMRERGNSEEGKG